MSDFEKLLAELSSEAEEQNTLAKSMPADDSEDDDQASTAAEEGDDEGKDGGADSEDASEDEKREIEDEDKDGIADDDEESLTKSLTVGDEEYTVVDAEALVKSLGDLTGRVDSQEAVLAKALETTLNAMKNQGEMIKSLSGKLEKLAGQGRGRKAVLTVHEKKTPADGGEQMRKSEQQEQISGPQLMAKALGAQKEGKLTGAEVSRLENYVNNGMQPPAEILARIN